MTDDISVVVTSAERGGVAGTGDRWKRDTRRAHVDTSIVGISADDSGCRRGGGHLSVCDDRDAVIVCRVAEGRVRNDIGAKFRGRGVMGVEILVGSDVGSSRIGMP